MSHAAQYAAAQYLAICELLDPAGLLPGQDHAEKVEVHLQDLGYLRQDVYDREWNQTLAAAKALTSYAAVDKARGAIKILYNSQKQYEDITGDFKMLREWKVRLRLRLARAPAQE